MNHDIRMLLEMAATRKSIAVMDCCNKMRYTCLYRNIVRPQFKVGTGTHRFPDLSCPLEGGQDSVVLVRTADGGQRVSISMLTTCRSGPWLDRPQCRKDVLGKRNNVRSHHVRCVQLFITRGEKKIYYIYNKIYYVTRLIERNNILQGDHNIFSAPSQFYVYWDSIEIYVI